MEQKPLLLQLFPLYNKSHTQFIFLGHLETKHIASYTPPTPNLYQTGERCQRVYGGVQQTIQWSVQTLQCYVQTNCHFTYIPYAEYCLIPALKCCCSVADLTCYRTLSDYSTPLAHCRVCTSFQNFHCGRVSGPPLLSLQLPSPPNS